MHVEAHDLVKTYPPGARALDGLSTTTEPAEILLVVASAPFGTVFSALSNVLNVLSVSSARFDRGPVA
jgi:hypothetical protein